eukprot:Protomagalhaensia_wolfi_Nauph_80__1639@NODE_200_length_3204_cov_14_814534_g149_i0_p4_GENE_NODE_200_length_3204_cov_14_814534_g149_i0NODE_200_length_3204_cov_14_814534_g149_i0_p4_ORF_typecomplete_len152_score33_65_NODE_200_length_3204_cov_14_814534_g149_i0225680
MLVEGMDSDGPSIGLPSMGLPFEASPSTNEPSRIMMNKQISNLMNSDQPSMKRPVQPGTGLQNPFQQGNSENGQNPQNSLFSRWLTDPLWFLNRHAKPSENWAQRLATKINNRIDPTIEVIKKKSTEQKSRTKVTGRGCICFICVCIFRSR